ncbi:MAG: AzlC family ABC transporter permease [Deltaproteobacteria bacterium]|nr:MAG: AzlC family ABC transporter permease [Deltaproteobacteria bacterium]
MRKPGKPTQTRYGDDLVLFNWTGIWTGAQQSIPIAFSVFAYGLVFGVLARQAQLSVAESLLMSGLVFAGASQFVALDLWVAPLPMVTIIFTTFVVNLRHLLMGAGLRDWFAGLSIAKAYGSLFFMNDESWALTMAAYARGERNAAFLLGSGLTVFLAWLSATFFGRLVVAVLKNPARWGLDFAFTAVFVALLVGMWRGKSDFMPWLVAAIVAILSSIWLPGKWYILIGGLTGSFVGAMRHED